MWAETGARSSCLTRESKVSTKALTSAPAQHGRRWLEVDPYQQQYCLLTLCYYCFFFLTRVSGLPQSIEIDQGPDKLFGRGFIWAPAAAVGRSLLLAHCPRETERAGFLYGVRGGVSPRVGLQSVVGGLPAPLLVLSAGGMRSILLLLPALQKWFFGLCVSCCPEFAPTVHAHSFF